MMTTKEIRSILTNSWFVGFICFIIGVTFVIGIILLLHTLSMLAWENKLYLPSFIRALLFLFCGYFLLVFLVYPISRPKTSAESSIIAATGTIATLSFMIIILGVVVISGINAGILEYYSTPKELASYSRMSSALFGALAGLVILIPMLILSRYLLRQTIKQAEKG
ncbi:MAG: hypothetical protein AB1485_06210 [Candidatus Thermoplasmatota archaeon]